MVNCFECIAGVEAIFVGVAVSEIISLGEDSPLIIDLIAALGRLGLRVSGAELVGWLKEAYDEGCRDPNCFAKFICKKLGPCS